MATMCSCGAHEVDPTALAVVDAPCEHGHRTIKTLQYCEECISKLTDNAVEGNPHADVHLLALVVAKPAEIIGPQSKEVC